MKRWISGLLMLSVALISLPGCAEKSTTSTEKKITTPDGTTTIKKETEIKKTGDNPPPATP